MKFQRLSCCCALFLCLLPGNVLSFDGTGSENARVSDELKALSASVDRLAQILAAQSDAREQEALFQKLNLAISYLNFRSRRIEMLEQDVQSSRNARAQIEATLNIWEQQRENLASSASSLPSEEMRLRNEELKVKVALIKERMAHLDSEIVALETKIYELQDQIDSVEEFVQKNLAL